MKKILMNLFFEKLSNNRKEIALEKWRAIFGYSVSLSWLLMVVTICIVIFREDEKSVEIINAFSETTALWGSVLGVLGISMMKNNVKIKKNNKKTKEKKEE